MAQKSILALLRTKLRYIVMDLRCQYFNKVWGMHIGRGSHISLKAHLDKTNPKGIYIGEYTTVVFGCAILSHDFVNMRHQNTRIGKCCFIGAHAIIFPGVTIGNHCIVSAASVVKQDVPDNCIVAGNPAVIVKTGIQTGPRGHRLRPAVAEVAPVAVMQSAA